MTPVIEGGWLKPGMHVVNIGPSDLGPDSRAKIDCVVRQGSESLPIPESDSYVAGMGHSRGAFMAGTPEERKRVPQSGPKKSHAGAKREWPTYADVIKGRAPGRTSRDQITQYQPVGNWGVQFSSVGKLIYENAKRLGLGRELPTELFLQDVKN
jgi:alanine dehydrogenase